MGRVDLRVICGGSIDWLDSWDVELEWTTWLGLDEGDAGVLVECSISGDLGRFVGYGLTTRSGRSW